VKIVLGIIIGGAIGFAVGYFGKCVSGVCPLTSNPIISSIIGALIGALLMMQK
jgi:phage shock protein E